MGSRLLPNEKAARPSAHRHGGHTAIGHVSLFRAPARRTRLSDYIFPAQQPEGADGEGAGSAFAQHGLSQSGGQAFLAQHEAASAEQQPETAVGEGAGSIFAQHGLSQSGGQAGLAQHEAASAEQQPATAVGEGAGSICAQHCLSQSGGQVSALAQVLASDEQVIAPAEQAEAPPAEQPVVFEAAQVLPELSGQPPSVEQAEGAPDPLPA